MEFETAEYLIEYIFTALDFCDDLRWEHENTLELFDIDGLARYLESIEDMVDYFYLYFNTLTVEIHYFSLGIVRLYCWS